MQVVNTFPTEYKASLIRSQHHCCSWLGDAQRQIISNHSIDLNIPNYSSPTTGRVDILRPSQNDRQIFFPDDIFKCTFLKENVWIVIKISLQFVLNGPINKIPTLVQITPWRRPGDTQFSEPMVVSLRMHICVAQPLWVKYKLSSWSEGLKPSAYQVH